MRCIKECLLLPISNDNGVDGLAHDALPDRSFLNEWIAPIESFNQQFHQLRSIVNIGRNEIEAVRNNQRRAYFKILAVIPWVCCLNSGNGRIIAFGKPVIGISGAYFGRKISHQERTKLFPCILPDYPIGSQAEACLEPAQRIQSPRPENSVDSVIIIAAALHRKLQQFNIRTARPVLQFFHILLPAYCDAIKLCMFAIRYDETSSCT